ncbi:MAG: hypothetical protein QM755_06960 [Luteolibacter sp.]
MSDNSGLFITIGGLIVLVFGGVIMSTAVDQRKSLLGFSRAINGEIDDNTHNISMLDTRRKRLQQQADETLTPRLAQGAELEAAESNLVDLRLKLDGLQTHAAELKTSTAATAGDFVKYRTAYRKSIWDAAANEKLPSLELRSGRRYENVTIVRVTAVGLEISHTDGNARIGTADLDDKWQRRFQWNDNERKAEMAREQAALQESLPSNTPASATAPALAAPTTGSPPSAAAPSRSDIDRLQIELNAWNAKIVALSAQRDEALNHQSQGGARSAPGSLETWGARATRLSSEITKASAYRDQVRSRLSAAGVWQGQ